MSAEATGADPRSAAGTIAGPSLPLWWRHRGSRRAGTRSVGLAAGRKGSSRVRGEATGRRKQENAKHNPPSKQQPRKGREAAENEGSRGRREQAGRGEERAAGRSQPGGLVHFSV